MNVGSVIEAIAAGIILEVILYYIRKWIDSLSKGDKPRK